MQGCHGLTRRHRRTIQEETSRFLENGQGGRQQDVFVQPLCHCRQRIRVDSAKGGTAPTGVERQFRHFRRHHQGRGSAIVVVVVTTTTILHFVYQMRQTILYRRSRRFIHDVGIVLSIKDGRQIFCDGGMLLLLLLMM